MLQLATFLDWAELSNGDYDRWRGELAQAVGTEAEFGGYEPVDAFVSGRSEKIVRVAIEKVLRGL